MQGVAKVSSCRARLTALEKERPQGAYGQSALPLSRAHRFDATLAWQASGSKPSAQTAALSQLKLQLTFWLIPEQGPLYLSPHTGHQIGR